MGKTMNLGMIKMFEEEVNNLFAPLMDEIQGREAALEMRADEMARQELGIYDLVMKKAKLELELEETKRKLKKYTDWNYRGGNRTSIHRDKVNQILAQLRAENPTLREVEETKKQVIRDVRIAALGPDMANLLTKTVPEIVERLVQKVKQLPPAPKVKELPSID